MKGRRRGRDRRLYWRFALSFLIVALIPLFLFSWLILDRFVDDLSLELEQNLSDPFDNALTGLELELQRFEEIAAELDSSPLLRSTDVLQRPYEAGNMRRELRMLTDSSLVDEAFYHNLRFDSVVGYTSIMSADTFMANILESDALKSRYEDFLSSDRQREYFHLTDREINLLDRSDHIALLQKVPVYYQRSSGVLLTLMPVAGLEQALQGGLAGDAAAVLVNPEDEEALLTAVTGVEGSALLERWSDYSGRTELLRAEPAESEDDSQNTDRGELIYQDQQMSVRRYSLEELPWTLLRLSSRTMLADRTTMVIRHYAVAVVLVIILSLIAVPLLTRYNYRFIERVGSLVETMTENEALDAADPDEQLDELERMERLLALYSQRHSELQQDVDASERIRRAYLMEAYLLGQAKQIENITALSKQSGLVFDQAYYHVLVLEVAEQRTALTADHQLLLEELTESLDASIILHGDERNGHLILVYGKKQKDAEPVKQLAEALLNELEVQGLQVYLGIGSAVSSSFELATSYEEALQVLEWNTAKQTNEYYFIESLRHVEMIEGQDIHRLIDGLDSALDARDVEQVQGAYAAIDSYIVHQELDVFWIKHMLLDCWSALTRHMATAGSGDSILEKPYASRLYLGKDYTPDDLQQMLRELEEDTLTWLAEGSDEFEQSLLSDIMSYLEAHGLDPQFSLKGLADSLDMSRPYLSQYFKKHTDQTISGYVTAMRMTRSKELLETTEDTIQDISEQVGYYSVSSFIRKFRELEGMTPGQYRDSLTDETR